MPDLDGLGELVRALHSQYPVKRESQTKAQNRNQGKLKAQSSKIPNETIHEGL